MIVEIGKFTEHKPILKIRGMAKELISTVLYRPFDTRFSYYTGNSRGLYSSPQKSNYATHAKGLSV